MKRSLPFILILASFMHACAETKKALTIDVEWNGEILVEVDENEPVDIGLNGLLSIRESLGIDRGVDLVCEINFSKGFSNDMGASFDILLDLIIKCAEKDRIKVSKVRILNSGLAEVVLYENGAYIRKKDREPTGK